MKGEVQFDDSPSPRLDPNIDLSRVSFVFGGKTVPGSKLAELLGMCPPATTAPADALQACCIPVQ
jgi:hypothetical protein